MAEEPVEATVPVSMVCEEVLEPGGDRELSPRLTSRIAGVVKDLGRVEEGRLADCISKPELIPTLCA